MSQIKDDGSLACKIRFNFAIMPILLAIYVTLIILFSHQYRLIATIFMMCFMLIVKLSYHYCPQTYWKANVYGYGLMLVMYMYMYVGMLIVSWIKFDNIVFAYILNALFPVVLLYLSNRIPIPLVQEFMTGFLRLLW